MIVECHFMPELAWNDALLLYKNTYTTTSFNSCNSCLYEAYLAPEAMEILESPTTYSDRIVSASIWWCTMHYVRALSSSSMWTWWRTPNIKTLLLILNVCGSTSMLCRLLRRRLATFHLPHTVKKNRVSLSVTLLSPDKGKNVHLKKFLFRNKIY